METELKKVYFAGKVSKGGGYRGLLLRNPRVMSDGYRKYSFDAGELLYGGPFALSCDHGCFHTGRHGILQGYADCIGIMDDDDLCEHNTFSMGDDPKPSVDRCLSQIQSCDAVHCYIDTISCYGTLFELGYANGIGKPIYIYYAKGVHNWDKHFWFILNSPFVKYCSTGNPTSIHPDLLTNQKTYKDRYYEYLRSPEWDARRKAKIVEAGGRCQLCYKSSKLNVHHRTYDRVFNELPTDLIALCEKCHSKFHDVENAS